MNKKSPGKVTLSNSLAGIKAKNGEDALLTCYSVPSGADMLQMG